MKYWKVIVPKLPAAAMALYPFMLFKYPSTMNQPDLVRHEEIHFRQQAELLLLPFYILYLSFYLINLIRYKNHLRAYYNISFEKEAYANDADPNYLSNRKWYAWLRFF